MKKLVIAMAVLFGTYAMAEGTTAAPAAAAAPVTKVAKVTKKDAKAQCKAEGKKGKDLKECVKTKTM